MSLITVTSRGLTNAGQIETGAIVSAAGPVFGTAINAVFVGAAVLAVAMRSRRLRNFTSSAQVDVGEPAAP